MRGTQFILSCWLVTSSLWLGCTKPDEAAVCERGSMGCGCREAATCDEGLACDQNRCVGEGVLDLNVLEARARGCEVLLKDRGPIVNVEFSDAVQGTHVREAPRTAVSFIAREDASIVDGSVRVHFADDGTGAPEVSLANCTDSAGAAIKASVVGIPR